MNQTCLARLSEADSEFSLTRLAQCIKECGPNHFDPRGTTPFSYIQTLLVLGEWSASVCYLLERGEAVAALLLGTVVTVVFMNFVISLQMDEASTGVHVLEAEINNEVTVVSDLARLISAGGNMNPAVLDITWQTNSKYQDQHAAYITTVGGIQWKSSSKFNLDDSIIQQALNDTISGLIIENGKLCMIASTKVGKVGTLIVYRDLSSSEYVDAVKDKTGADLSLFNGNTRYSTTLTDSEGNRYTGTEMDAGIWAEVQAGHTYSGKAYINGVSYYVSYEPMTDINGNIIGAYFAGCAYRYLCGFLRSPLRYYEAAGKEAGFRGREDMRPARDRVAGFSRFLVQIQQ